MPLPHRWLTALVLKYNGSHLLIDCGEGTQIAMKEAGESLGYTQSMVSKVINADMKDS
mgnify:CR=1 FL=1